MRAARPAPHSNSQLHQSACNSAQQHVLDGLGCLALHTLEIKYNQAIQFSTAHAAVQSIRGMYIGGALANSQKVTKFKVQGPGRQLTLSS
jgi:hypothetical protein